MDLAIYSTGWKYPRPELELEALRNNKYHPTTDDMKVVAENLGYHIEGVGSPTEFVSTLKTLVKPEDRLRNLAIFAHGDGKRIGFGGNLAGTSLAFDPTLTLTVKSLQIIKSDLSFLKDKVSDGANIIIYTCNSGHYAVSLDKNNNLLGAFADVFGIPTSGFTVPIFFCVQVQLDGDNLSIIDRGYVRKGNPPFSGSCTDPKRGFTKNIKSLQPDVICKRVGKNGEIRCPKLE